MKQKKKTDIKNALLKVVLPSGPGLAVTSNINRLFGQYQINQIKFKEKFEKATKNWENNLMLNTWIAFSKIEQYEILIKNINTRFIFDLLTEEFGIINRPLKDKKKSKIQSTNKFENVKKPEIPAYIVYNLYNIIKLAAGNNKNYNINSLFNILNSFKDLKFKRLV